MFDLDRVAPSASLDRAGLDRAGLERVDAHLRDRIDSGELSGTVLRIWRGGALVHAGVQGLRDVERQVPMTDDTVFRLYSMTKPIASVALMQCYERGLVQLDDPVHDFIPTWRDLQVDTGDGELVACERPITVRDLLTHQSGVQMPLPIGDDAAAARGATLAELVARLSETALGFQPGAHFNYGVSTDVVGRLVEILSGEPFDAYLERHVFEPLGMTETAFWVPPDRAHRLAALYLTTADGLTLMNDPETSGLRTRGTYFSGAGGLTSTADDYSAFLMMLRGAGTWRGERILGRKTLELMTTNHLTGGKTIAEATNLGFFDHYGGQGFGLGFGVFLDHAAAQLSGTPGEFSWTGAAGTLGFVDPVEDLVVLFLTQSFPDIAGRGVRNPYKWRELRAMIYAALD